LSFLHTLQGRLNQIAVLEVRFGKIIVKTGVSCLNCVVFGKVGRDVDIRRVRIEHLGTETKMRWIGCRMAMMRVSRRVWKSCGWGGEDVSRYAGWSKRGGRFMNSTVEGRAIDP
jgi:hypothetical protein